jgi:hypothetical protein
MTLGLVISIGVFTTVLIGIQACGSSSGGNVTFKGAGR